MAVVAPPSNVPVSVNEVAAVAPTVAPSMAPSVPAVDWTRRRIIAFQARVMGGAAGGSGSGMPEATQFEPYEQEAAFQDARSLAAAGVLITPYYMFTAKYNVTLDGARASALLSWMDVEAAIATEATAERREAAATATLEPAAGEATGKSVWDAAAGIDYFSVAVPAAVAVAPRGTAGLTPLAAMLPPQVRQVLCTRRCRCMRA